MGWTSVASVKAWGYFCCLRWRHRAGHLLPQKRQVTSVASKEVEGGTSVASEEADNICCLQREEAEGHLLPSIEAVRQGHLLPPQKQVGTITA